MTPADPGGPLEEWRIRLETVEPGWLILPGDLPRQEWDAWVRAATGELREAWGEQWDPRAEDDVRTLLGRGLEDRAASPSVAVLQVWPVFAPIVAMCRVTLMSTQVAPPWRDLGGVLHGVEAEGLGSGLQWVDRSAVSLPHGESVETVTVHYAFDDGTTTVIVGVDETPVGMYLRLLSGLRGMLESIRIERADGARFRGVRPAWLMEDAPWEIEVS
ncbi:hypothetical protein [Microbacterium album]|uniref:Uncharacterized protein n=1 Tax=Microbacterium album TaxID=2053191 RepID=A0A917IGC9_9MICO|nr:hypothetical protein [Microbacterium album]GGH42881.1 hypothetical protein GCM10010921_16370 [Microbacterium album]